MGFCCSRRASNDIIVTHLGTDTDPSPIDTPEASYKKVAGLTNHATLTRQDTSSTFTVLGAGYVPANGMYWLDGMVNGTPKYKHGTRKIWIRKSEDGDEWQITFTDASTANFILYSAPVGRHVLSPPESDWIVSEAWTEELAKLDNCEAKYDNIGTRDPAPTGRFSGTNGSKASSCASLERSSSNASSASSDSLGSLPGTSHRAHTQALPRLSEAIAEFSEWSKV